MSGFLLVIASQRGAHSRDQESVEFEALTFLPRSEGRYHTPLAVNAPPLPTLVPVMLSVGDNLASRANDSNSIVEWLSTVVRRWDHEIEFAVDVSNLPADRRPRETILEIVRAVVHCFNRHWDDATSNVEPLAFSCASPTQ